MLPLRYPAGVSLKLVVVSGAQFRFSLWSVLTTLVVFSILMKLGFWQLQRAEQKQQWLEKFDQQGVISGQELVDLMNENSTQKENLTGRKVQLKGLVKQEQIWLLDNQVFQSQVGYSVITKLQLPISKQQVWVNWGWIKADKRRDVLPLIPLPKSIEFSGVIKATNFANLVLREDALQDSIELQRIQSVRPLFEFDSSLPQLVIYADSNSVNSWPQNYQHSVMPPEKHHAYAMQWFLLAIASVLVSIFASFKRPSAGQIEHINEGVNHDL